MACRSIPAMLLGAVLCAGFAPPDAAEAQERAEALTLARLLELAAENNPTLAQARSRIEAAEATALQAGTWPNPILSYTNETVNNHQSDGAYARQFIPTSGRFGRDKAVHERDADVGRAAFAMQSARVRNSVHMLYRSALIAAARVELQEEALALAEEQLATTVQLANVGLADRTDVLEAEMELHHARLDLKEDMSEHLHSRRQLALTVGDPDLADAPLAGDEMELPGELDRDALLASLLDEGPQLRVVDAELDRHAAIVGAEEVEALPDVELALGVRYNRGSAGFGHDEPVPPSFEAFAEVDFIVPIWNRNQHGVTSARAELSEEEHNRLREDLMLRESFSDEYKSYLVERNEARVFRDEVLTRAEELHGLALGRYEDFGEDYSEVLEARAMVLDVRHKVLEALENSWHKHVLLEGFLLSGGLMHPLLFKLTGLEASTVR